MRAPNRIPLPDLALLLEEVNLLLAKNGLLKCHTLDPVADGDTANPNVIGYSKERQYVIKVTYRHPDTLDIQREVANELRAMTNLPIPRHFCWSAPKDRFPLMIMEWLPGNQLRTVLASTKKADLKLLCSNLAACLAMFHDPAIRNVAYPMSDPTSTWLYAQTLEVLKALTEKTLVKSVKPFEIDSVHRYLEARLTAMETTAIPAIEKADLDLRDFLVNPDTFEISGMLDWERVTRGDGVFAIALIFFRLWLNQKLDGWNDFCITYNRLASVKAQQCPQVEFYLMCRAVLALQFNNGASDLIDLLLQGNRLPFSSAIG